MGYEYLMRKISPPQEVEDKNSKKVFLGIYPGPTLKKLIY
jgi:hypothetical protein